MGVAELQRAAMVAGRSSRAWSLGRRSAVSVNALRAVKRAGLGLEAIAWFTGCVAFADTVAGAGAFLAGHRHAADSRWRVYGRLPVGAGNAISGY